MAPDQPVLDEPLSDAVGESASKPGEFAKTSMPKITLSQNA